MKFALLAAAAASLASAASPASAGVTFFTNQIAYDAAVTAVGGNLSSFNFNTTPTGDYSTPAGVTVDGVNFVGNTGGGGYLLSISPPYFCCSDYNNPNATLQAPPVSSSYYSVPNGYTTITLPGGATAFSFDAYSVQAGDYTDSGHDTLNLDVDGSIGRTITLPGSVTGFLGFLSTTPVSSVTLYGSTPEEFIDVVDGTVSAAVPEPSTWATLMLGILGAGVVLRRRRQARSAAAVA